ncbi:hypothetical protein ACH5RR_004389 [Cinchona calisaya]|uniref:Prolamin-like domain-containing protein n=1 Tax=Cinchona calisaya TaxID=153742 RepID=A0ABD3AXG9_9GENT
MASFSASFSLLLVVACLAMFFPTGLAQEPQQQLAIEGTKQSHDFNKILQCLAALPAAIGACGADIFKILEGREKANQYSLSKNCCGAIFNIAAKCDLAKLRIDPRITRSILEACARGAASPPTPAVEEQSNVDKDLSWQNLF